MLNIKVNGQPATLPPGALVVALVATMQLEGKRYAIERNGEIVPKSAVDSTPVEDGDQYEVVIAVGGG
ncbi:MAG: sulfur carrier protein ThiS [Burkholderiales bacterium]|jgi:thiamine biosynthesis protein ThiS|nr:sulfur carrier protein ThiS [Rhodocyclaceae bacterium]MCA3023211.1 sulfur carrier protein ThiS [Rhodocyclaceae bacterium]MCA3053398.1 sulfur carrier protein ThiS [Rhodocyclaceae bacterium]MCA3057147.1 sulfur carrier protein ThiS [Rhodocyclaceae bacterium]